MNAKVFEDGFLRIASRIKEVGNRRSALYKRRFTGAKGIGRLAAHKLAKRVRITSVPDPNGIPGDSDAIIATIDWHMIEQCETLEEASRKNAVTVDPIDTGDQVGTKIVLTDLRRKWTPAQRTHVIREINAFQPPKILVEVPKEIHSDNLLFGAPRIRDVSSKNRDPGFEVTLLGDFEVGEEYWTAVAHAADWILEIESTAEPMPMVRYLITPTIACKRSLPEVTQHRYKWDNPPVEVMPKLAARILYSRGLRRFQKRSTCMGGRQCRCEGIHGGLSRVLAIRRSRKRLVGN